MANLEDPEVRDLLGQLARTSRISAITAGLASFTVLMGGVLVAVGRILPTVPIATVLAIVYGVVIARENTKAIRIRAKIQSVMFPPKG